MPRPLTPPKRGFRLPPELTPYVKSLVPNYEDDTLTITMEINNNIMTRTIPFHWDNLEDFEARAAALIRRLKQ